MCPYISVEVVRMPQRCAVRMTSTHCAVESLLAERMWRISSSRISAAVPGKRPKPVVAQHGEIVGQRHAGEFDAVDNFHRRKGVDMHARHGVLDRAKNVAIVKLGKIVRQTALNADFGGAKLPGFDRLLRHLIERQEVGVGLARAAAEGAEFASHETDVGEIDVAVDYVGDDVAGEFGAQQVGGDQQAEQIVAFGVGQRVGFFQRQVGAVLCFENLF